MYTFSYIHTDSPFKDVHSVSTFDFMPPVQWCNLIIYIWIQCVNENSVDPDQLASSEAS